MKARHRVTCCGFTAKSLVLWGALTITAVVSEAASLSVVHDPNGNTRQFILALPVGAPSLLSPPRSALGFVGGSVSLSVKAEGSPSLGFQWRRNGTNIPGATNDALLLANLTAPDFADYTVIVSNAFGSVTSSPPATVYLDSDRDQLPDSWELANFGSITNTAYGDNDNDGVLNFEEFADGTSPTNNSSRFLRLTLGEGIEAQPSNDRYPPGAVVTLTASSAAGLIFNEWSGALTGSRNPTSFTVVTNATIAAVRSSHGLDPIWKPTFTDNDGGVYSLLVQPDDKLLVAGRFSEVNGFPAQNLARLNADGSVDTDFLAALGIGPADGSHAYEIARQPDGKIVVVGDFSTVNNRPRPGVARLNSDGSLDETFVPPGINSAVLAVALLNDGRVVIGGSFTQVGSASRNRIAVLNPNGSLNTNFVVGTGLNADVYGLAVQPGDRILAAGLFTTYNGQTNRYLVRLDTNGVADATFNPGGSGPNDYADNPLVLPDGRVLVVGRFTQFNGAPASRAVLLSANGVPDPSFNVSPALNNNPWMALRQPDGRFLLCGDFTSSGTSAAQRLVRLNTNGSLDNTFSTTSAANDTVATIALQSSGRLLAGGEFSTWANQPQDRLISLNPTNGTPETNFFLHAAMRSLVSNLSLEPDGSVMAVGDFLAVNGRVAQRVARITPRGDLDPSFALPGPLNAGARSFHRQRDGKYLVGGGFGSIGSTVAGGIMRLLPDGSLDPAFQTGAGFNGPVDALLELADGRILVGGEFNAYNGADRPRLARLLPNGTRDDTFTSFPDSAVYALALQPDGKAIVAGTFSQISGVPRMQIARLLEDGSLDPSFDPGGGPVGGLGDIQSVALLPDGRILVAGNFQFFDGVRRRNLARLLPDGTPDITFGFDNAGTSHRLWRIALQSDGSIYAVGDFNEVNGQALNRAAHFWSDGSLDTTFNPGTGPDDQVFALGVGADQSVYLGGWIRELHGQPRASMLRLVTAPGLQVEMTGTQPPGTNFNTGQAIQLSAKAVSVNTELVSVRFEVSTDGVTFLPLNGGISGALGTWVGNWTPSAPGIFFVRAVATDDAAREQASFALGPLNVTTPGTGGYANWVAANFSPSEQANPAISGQLADPDGDSSVNLLEYAFGTLPKSAASISHVTGSFVPPSGAPQYLALTYRRNLAATDLQYIAQVSTDLVTWLEGPASTTLVDAVSNGDGTETVRMRANVPITSGTSLFMRLKLVGP